jgi:hypothetical protein
MATIVDFNALAFAQIGVPYVFGGTSLKGSPHPGLDCSGLPYAVSLALGKNIPRTSEAQFAGLPSTSPSQGVLVFYDVPTDTQPQPAHVAIWWDPWHVLQAPRTGEDVGIYPNTALPYEIMGYRQLPFPAAPPSPPTPPQGEDMIAPTPSGNGYWLCSGSGAIITRGDAQYLGGPNTSIVNGAWGGPPNLPAGQTCVSIASHPTSQGYWVESSAGDIYSYGAAGWYGNTQ